MDKLLKVAVITWAAFLVLLAGMLLTANRQEAGADATTSLPAYDAGSGSGRDARIPLGLWRTAEHTGRGVQREASPESGQCNCLYQGVRGGDGIGEDPDEDALITAALEDQGYFRADVPLDYELQDVLHSACEEFGVEYSLMLALIEQETLFQNITGDGGDSVGYCQIQKKWWHGLMDDIGAKDLKDPQDNFRTGCAILAELIDKYGNAEDALSAYNTGNGGKTRYAQEVMARYAAWMERTNV